MKAVIDLTVSVKVHDYDRLKAYASERVVSRRRDVHWSPVSPAQAVYEALIGANENPEPETYGIRILEAKPKNTFSAISMPCEVDLHVKVAVQDVDQLMAFATERIESCWGPTSGVEMNNLGDVVYEALFASNGNPTPADYGIEIVAHRYDAAIDATAETDGNTVTLRLDASMARGLLRGVQVLESELNDSRCMSDDPDDEADDKQMVDAVTLVRVVLSAGRD